MFNLGVSQFWGEEYVQVIVVHVLKIYTYLQYTGAHNTHVLTIYTYLLYTRTYNIHVLTIYTYLQFTRTYNIHVLTIYTYNYLQYTRTDIELARDFF